MSPLSRVTSEPLAVLIDRQINLPEMSRPFGGIKPSVIYERSSHSAFLLVVAFHCFYLTGDANELANNEFNEYRRFSFFFFVFKAIPFELTFVLCVTNIDLYGDLFQNFDLNNLQNDFYAVTRYFGAPCQSKKLTYC